MALRPRRPRPPSLPAWLETATTVVAVPPPWRRSLLVILACLGAALLVAYAPAHEGLGLPGRHALFVLVLAAGLWVTEAVPAFAVGLLVIALEIALLGDPAGEFAAGDRRRWESFVSPWGSPVMWLFLGGLVLAAAAHKTELDRWFAARMLRRFGGGPRRLLLGVMGITFVFSMFMSNTATTAMMLAVLAPVVDEQGEGGTPTARALLLGIPVAANVGGMATLIGTPPNAIAAGVLSPLAPIDFARWMMLGLPVALLLGVLSWGFLVLRYRPAGDAPTDAPALAAPSSDPDRLRPRLLVMGVFAATVLLWISQPLHGIPTAVVAVMPIATLAVAGVLTAADVRALPWDVLLLLAGGLALGVGVSDTGLAAWLVERVRPEGLGPIALALAMAALGVLLSNFISNTAAANILAPMALALAPGAEAQLVVPLALATSAAMCLPASTPPNAIAFASGRLSAREFLAPGLLLGLLAPGVAVLWVWLVGPLVLGN